MATSSPILDINPPGVADKFVIDETLNSGATVDLLNENVPAGERWALDKLKISTRSEAVIKVFIAGNLAGFGRTEAASPDFSFSWQNFDRVQPGDAVKVTAEAQSGMANAPLQGRIDFFRETL